MTDSYPQGYPCTKSALDVVFEWTSSLLNEPGLTWNVIDVIVQHRRKVASEEPTTLTPTAQLGSPPGEAPSVPSLWPVVIHTIFCTSVWHLASCRRSARSWCCLPRPGSDPSKPGSYLSKGNSMFLDHESVHIPMY